MSSYLHQVVHGTRLPAQFFFNGMQQLHGLVDRIGFAPVIQFTLHGFKLQYLFVQALGVDIPENDGVGKHGGLHCAGQHDVAITRCLYAPGQKGLTHPV